LPMMSASWLPSRSARVALLQYLWICPWQAIGWRYSRSTSASVAAIPSIDLELLADASREFSGAEIESAVKAALLEAFEDGQRPLRTEDLQRAIRRIRPLAQIKPTEIEDCVVGRVTRSQSTRTVAPAWV